jgi:hypothetical protein
MIDYIDIINLGFEVEQVNDNIFLNQHGYPYCIFTLFLTKNLYIEWQQPERTCTLNRMDSDSNIKARRNIRDYEHLREIIDFFKVDDDKDRTDYSEMHF